MKMRVTTETGSYYDIDTVTREWSKNGGGNQSPLKEILSGEYDTWRTAYMEGSDWKEVEIPEIGKSMIISGEKAYNWWRTTHVTKVEVQDEV